MMPLMLRLQILLVLLAGLLAGCGQVSVFGHTIGEKSASQGSADPGGTEPAKAEPIKAEPPNAATTAADTTPTKTGAKQAGAIPTIQKVGSVKLVLTPQVAAKVRDDSRFNADELLDAIKSELQSRKVLDDSNTHASTIAEISIDEYSMRPTSNAILFGNIISNGTLNGSIRLRDEQGNDLPGYRVEAASRVSIPANGESKHPLAPLYRRFALTLADFLAGTPGKSTEPVEQRPH